MRKLKLRLTEEGKYDVGCSISVHQYFSSQDVGDAPLNAYLVMATVSYQLSIYKDPLSGIKQFFIQVFEHFILCAVLSAVF